MKLVFPCSPIFLLHSFLLPHITCFGEWGIKVNVQAEYTADPRALQKCTSWARGKPKCEGECRLEGGVGRTGDVGAAARVGRGDGDGESREREGEGEEGARVRVKKRRDTMTCIRTHVWECGLGFLSGGLREEVLYSFYFCQNSACTEEARWRSNMYIPHSSSSLRANMIPPT